MSVCDLKAFDAMAKMTGRGVHASFCLFVNGKTKVTYMCTLFGLFSGKGDGWPPFEK